MQPVAGCNMETQKNLCSLNPGCRAQRMRVTPYAVHAGSGARGGWATRRHRLREAGLWFEDAALREDAAHWRDDGAAQWLALSLNLTAGWQTWEPLAMARNESAMLAYHHMHLQEQLDQVRPPGAPCPTTKKRVGGQPESNGRLGNLGLAGCGCRPAALLACQSGHWQEQPGTGAAADALLVWCAWIVRWAASAWAARHQHLQEQLARCDLRLMLK